MANLNKFATLDETVLYSKNLIGMDEWNAYLVNITPGKKFTFSCPSLDFFTNNAKLNCIDVNGQLAFQFDIEAGTASQTFENTSNQTIKYLSWMISPNTECQIELGEIATMYEPCHRVGIVLEDYVYKLRDSLVGEINNNWRTGEANSAAIEGIKEEIEQVDSRLSESIDEISDLHKSKNLFNKNAIVTGGYINSGNGAVVPSEDFCMSEKLYLEPNSNFAMVQVNHMCFFDASGNIITGSTVTGSTGIVPNNAEYAIASIKYRQHNLDACQIEYGTEITEYEPYYNYRTVKLMDGSVTTEKLEDKSVTDKKLAIIKTVLGKNLFNKETVEVGYVSYSNGQINKSADTYRASDFIAVESGEQYTMSDLVGGMQTAFYDADKKYVSGILHSASVGLTVTIPDNAVYLRTTTMPDKLDNFAVSKGTVAVRVPYEKKEVVDPIYIDLSSALKIDVDIVVDQHGKGHYTSLTEAVNHAVDGDVIFVRCGIYDNEEVEGWGKDITIIGEDMLNTVIKNGLNTYSRPPMELSAGRLSNMTVYAYDGGGESLDPNGWKPYSIHIDNNHQYKNTLRIDNCILMSDKGSAIGIGLRGGELRFDNCKFVSRDARPFYFHDTVSTAYTDAPQNLTVKDCYGIAKTSARVMLINSQKTVGSKVYPEFINCSFVSDVTDTPTIEAVNVDNSGGQATEVGTFMNLINFYQVKTSRNNYPTSLDYQY